MTEQTEKSRTFRVTQFCARSERRVHWTVEAPRWLGVWGVSGWGGGGAGYPGTEEGWVCTPFMCCDYALYGVAHHMECNV